MVKKLLLSFGVAIFLGSGAFILAQAQTASPTNFSAQSPSACAVSLSWNQTQPAQGAFRLVRKISPGGTQEFDLPALAPSGSSYSCVDNAFTQNVAAGGGCGAAVWSGYEPNTSVSYQIKFCPTGGNCSSAAPSPALSVSTIALPPAPATPAAFSSPSFFWQPQGTFAYAKAYTSGSQVTLYFKTSAGQPLSNKFKQYGGFIIDRSSGSGSDTGFPKFVPAAPASITDLGGGNYSFSYSDNVSSDVSYTYTVKFYESDQYCKPEADSKQYIDSGALSAVVPAIPKNFEATQSMSGQNISVNLSWTKPSGAGEFTVLRSSDPNFPQGSAGTTIVGSNIPNLQVTDSDNLNAFATYYYRVAACSNPAGGCSDFANAQITTGAIISNPTASIVPPIGPTTATVLIKWDSQGNFTKIWVERTDASQSGSAPTVLNCAANGLNNYCNDPNAVLGKVYLYQVKGKSATPVQNPPPFTFSLNFSPIKGWAFGYAPPASASETHGIGWVRLSADATSSVWGPDTVPPGLAADSHGYGLTIDNTSGVISGAGWSGIECAASENRPAGTTCGYGWLNFGLSQNDLYGCADAQARQTNGQTCQGSVDLSTGKVDGWAKFTSADPTKGAWDGWVSLRGTNYGVCYGTALDASGLTCKGDGATNNILSGWAWGSDVGGWLNFGVLIPPVINNATTKCTGTTAGSCSATINWTNPMEYKNVKIYQSLKGQPNNKGAFKVRGEYNFDTSIGNHTDSVQGLDPGINYGFFLRATPQ